MTGRKDEDEIIGVSPGRAPDLAQDSGPFDRSWWVGHWVGFEAGLAYARTGSREDVFQFVLRRLTGDGRDDG